MEEHLGCGQPRMGWPLWRDGWGVIMSEGFRGRGGLCWSLSLLGSSGAGGGFIARGIPRILKDK